MGTVLGTLVVIESDGEHKLSKKRYVERRLSWKRYAERTLSWKRYDEVGPYVLEKMACRELEYKTNYRSPIMNETRSLLETFYYDSQRDMDSILEEYGIDLSLQPQNEIASKINCSRFIAKRNKVKRYF
ncbi:Hypothetical predicted protein, partial [Mytilus galloprovincialis]